MTYSESLGRHINVSIESSNHFDYAELEEAISALPNYPETSPSEVRAAAERGDLNARLVLDRAKTGDEVAQEWI